LVRRALEAHRRGAPKQAAAFYTRALKLEAGRFEALHGLGCLRFQEGRCEEAIRLLAAALKADPASAVAHANLGAVQGAVGDLADAVKSFERALSLEPGLPGALNGRGNALAQLGRHAEAVANYDQMLQVRPDAGVLGERAAALMELGRTQEALADAEAALALRPDLVRALIIRGNALRALGRLVEALASYDEVRAIDAREAAAPYNRGLVLADLGRLDEALESFGRALELRPRDARVLHNRGNALRALRRWASALRDFDAAVAITPDHAELLNDRANVLKDLGRDQEALAGYDAAIAARADCAEAHDNRGVLLLELGQPDAAAEAIETSIRLAPERVRSYYDLTLARPVKAGDPCLLALEKMAEGAVALSAQERIELNFALAKAYADLEDHEAAFPRLLEANALKRAATGYDEQATLDGLRQAREVFTPALIRSRSGQGHPSEAPIFVIGMPRSGTSLVEQVLASHPQVFGAGETDLFADAAAQVLKGCDAEGEQLSAGALVALGGRYLDRIQARAPGAARFTDKTLDNARFAGLIHLALPNARIIHVRRDPVDTCVSCFSTLFFGELGFAYDLGELGRYHRAREALMAHWRAALPPQTFLEVRYEALVGDLEGETRRLLAHCALDWSPACLDFHRTQRPVRTASVNQVRQPLYRSSVGRWKAYEQRLGPLLAALQGADPEGR
jgi:tetratricopeptide (TPR) repeat protein